MNKIRACSILALLLAVSQGLRAEEVRFTTYYPAPYSNYAVMVSSGDTVLAADPEGRVGVATGPTGAYKLSVTGQMDSTAKLSAYDIKKGNLSLLGEIECGAGLKCWVDASNVLQVRDCWRSPADCQNAPTPRSPCVSDDSCSAYQLCGQTTYGVDNCGKPCKHAWPACCVSKDGTCNAPAPGCGQTTYGVDNCGRKCVKTGPSSGDCKL